MIVVLVLTADIEEAIDRARSAQHFAARLDDLPVVQLGFRLGLVQPIDFGIVEQLAVAERDVNPDMSIMAAGFEQEHAVTAGFGEAVGEHAAGRSGADDDVIEPCFVRNRRHRRLLTPFSLPRLLSITLLRPRAAKRSGGGGPPIARVASGGWWRGLMTLRVMRS